MKPLIPLYSQKPNTWSNSVGNRTLFLKQMEIIPFVMMLGTLEVPLGKPSGTKTAFPGEMSCALNQTSHNKQTTNWVFVHQYWFSAQLTVFSNPLTTLPTVLLRKNHISAITLLPTKTLRAFYCFRKQYFYEDSIQDLKLSTYPNLLCDTNLFKFSKYKIWTYN